MKGTGCSYSGLKFGPQHSWLPETGAPGISVSLPSWVACTCPHTDIPVHSNVFPGDCVCRLGVMSQRLATLLGQGLLLAWSSPVRLG